MASPSVSAFPGAGGVVTPEAVLLQFETAGVATRALARVIDAAAAAAGGLLLFGLLAPQLGDTDDFVLVALVIGFLVLFVYPAVWETWSDGRTLGKSALGLRVVTEEGGPIRFRHAAIRSALQVVDFAVPPVGVGAIVSALAGRTDQRLGDRLAGTIVLRVRSAAADARAVAFPPLPGYEGYVDTLDVTTVTAEQYEVLRSFLTRVGELTPPARAKLSGALARPVAAAMHHAPPPGMHPEHFLASVAAAYQRRHGGPAVALPWASWAPTQGVRR